MIHLGDRTIIPIGCSCINQFQTGFFFGEERCRGSLFQWTITTPRTTVEVLDYARAGTLAALFADKAQFEMDGAHMRNRNFDGFYHWHENAGMVLGTQEDAFTRFKDKVAHLAANMQEVEGTVWLLWSNIQPNLRQEVEDNTRLTWKDFRLTRQRRDAIREAARALYGDPRFVFVARKEDIDEDLWDEEEVRLMEVPRSDKFRGAKDLYANIFREMDVAA